MLDSTGLRRNSWHEDHTKSIFAADSEALPVMIARTPTSGAAALAYWEAKAADYPRPDDAPASADAAALRAAAAGLGARWARRTVLDVGAGTGLHARPFAAEAARVVAVDLSPTMLAPLRAGGDVETVAADFLTVDMAARGWEGAFDLVWACMTPVCGAAEGVARLEAASRDQVACVTWGPAREDPVIAGAFALHGARFAAPDWHACIAAHLAQAGRAHARLTLPWEMVREVPVARLVADLAAHLEWLGVAPDRAALERYGAGLAREGRVRRALRAERVVWLGSVR